MNRWRKLARIFVTTLLVVALLGAGGTAYWLSRTHPASDLALQALQSDALVKVAEQNGIITFEPVGTQAATGFIFYPGAGVDYRAYAPVLRSIAERGYFVALVDMPLNLAFFRADAATDVMESYTEIDVWAVGGHSLGGVVAAMYAAARPIEPVYPLGGPQGLGWLRDVLDSSSARSLTASREGVSITLRR